jgi:ketosteroid isomerase-like protein
MSHENVEVAVKQFEGATARDFAGVMDTWADDVTLTLHWEANPLSGTVTSKAAVGKWHWDRMRQFGLDYRFDIEDMHDAGESVFVRESVVMTPLTRRIALPRRTRHRRSRRRCRCR